LKDCGLSQRTRTKWFTVKVMWTRSLYAGREVLGGGRSGATQFHLVCRGRESARLMRRPDAILGGLRHHQAAGGEGIAGAEKTEENAVSSGASLAKEWRAWGMPCYKGLTSAGSRAGERSLRAPQGASRASGLYNLAQGTTRAWALLRQEGNVFMISPAVRDPPSKPWASHQPWGEKKSWKDKTPDLLKHRGLGGKLKYGRCAGPCSPVKSKRQCPSRSQNRKRRLAYAGKKAIAEGQAPGLRLPRIDARKDSEKRQKERGR